MGSAADVLPGWAGGVGKGLWVKPVLATAWCWARVLWHLEGRLKKPHLGVILEKKWSGSSRVCRGGVQLEFTGGKATRDYRVARLSSGSGGPGTANRCKLGNYLRMCHPVWVLCLCCSLLLGAHVKLWGTAATFQHSKGKGRWKRTTADCRKLLDAASRWSAGSMSHTRPSL